MTHTFHAPRPVLVCTDCRDDLARAPLRIHIDGDGNLEPYGGTLAEILSAVASGGVVVFARDATPSAVDALGGLCARARETGRPAVVLRRGTPTLPWPAFPLSALEDVHAARWSDARGAWTARIKCERSGDFPGAGLATGRLVYAVADRRTERALRSFSEFLHGRFSAELRPRITGFIVTSLFDGGAPSRFDFVTGHDIEQTYTQAWLFVPDTTRSDLETVDLGTNMLDDSRPHTSHRLHRSDRQLAQALATIHDVYGNFELLHRLVDVLTPLTGGDNNDPRGNQRRALLRELLPELGNPPCWIEAGSGPSWNDELPDHPRPDFLSAVRIRAGLEPDDREGRIVVVACDLDANRLLPPIPGRQDDPARIGIVPVDDNGAVRAPFSVVRYGDRMPRGEPTLFVLLGRRSALTLMTSSLKTECGMTVVECPTDGSTSTLVPSFADAAGLLRKIAAFLVTRSDELFPLELIDLQDVIDTAMFSKRWLRESEFHCRAEDLHAVMTSVALRAAGELELVLVHIEVAEALASRERLVELKEAINAPDLRHFAVSPRSSEDTAIVTTWWSPKRPTPSRP